MRLLCRWRLGGCRIRGCCRFIRKSEGCGHGRRGRGTAKRAAARGSGSAVTGRNGVASGAEPTETYRHPHQARQRPDVGVQEQFAQKRPPKTYRYDSSLDPALSWDENRDRELAEWLIG